MLLLPPHGHCATAAPPSCCHTHTHTHTLAQEGLVAPGGTTRWLLPSHVAEQNRELGEPGPRVVAGGQAEDGWVGTEVKPGCVCVCEGGGIEAPSSYLPH